MVSAAGGVDIDEVAAKTPEQIIKVQIDPLQGLQAFQRVSPVFLEFAPAGEPFPRVVPGHLQQALIFGYAVPMPVVVRTRDYGTPESYKELGFRGALERKKESDKDLKDLFAE